MSFRRDESKQIRIIRISRRVCVQWNALVAGTRRILIYDHLRSGLFLPENSPDYGFRFARYRLVVSPCRYRRFPIEIERESINAHRAEPMQIAPLGLQCHAVALFNRLLSAGLKSDAFVRQPREGVARAGERNRAARRSISLGCFPDFCHADLAAARTSSRAALLKARRLANRPTGRWLTAGEKKLSPAKRWYRSYRMNRGRELAPIFDDGCYFETKGALICNDFCIYDIYNN